MQVAPEAAAPDQGAPDQGGPDQGGVQDLVVEQGRVGRGNPGQVSVRLDPMDRQTRSREQLKPCILEGDGLRVIGSP